MEVDVIKGRSVPMTVALLALLLQPLLINTLSAQSAVAESATAPAVAPAGGSGSSPLAPGQDTHIFGVLPNYRTAEGDVPFKPITTHQKFWIATKDTLDFPSYGLAAFFSGVSQLSNSNPSFGQGMQGYAKRYAAGVADQDLGNFMTEAIMPSLLHEDPRYFRKAHGSFKSRLAYAATRVLITKNDNGRNGFNFAEFSGNGMVAAVGNLYYPDDKGFSPTMQRMFTQIGTDAISGVLKEFWPDVKRKWLHKKAGTN